MLFIISFHYDQLFISRFQLFRVIRYLHYLIMLHILICMHSIVVKVFLPIIYQKCFKTFIDIGWDVLRSWAICFGSIMSDLSQLK